MPDDAVLGLETRRRIFDLVARQPGRYLRELQRALAMPMGMLEYHLRRLEEAGLVAVEQGEQKRFFPRQMPPADRKHVALLRQEPCRLLVLRLLERPGASHRELLRLTSYRPSTLSDYLAKLVAGGIAERTRDGRENRYRLADPQRAHALLVRLRPSFLDRVLDRFLEGFDAVHLAERDG